MKRNLTVMLLLTAFVWIPLMDACRQVSVLPARMLAVGLADASMFAVSKDYPAPPRRMAILRRLQRERRNTPERTWTEIALPNLPYDAKFAYREVRGYCTDLLCSSPLLCM